MGWPKVRKLVLCRCHEGLFSPGTQENSCMAGVKGSRRENPPFLGTYLCLRLIRLASLGNACVELEKPLRKTELATKGHSLPGGFEHPFRTWRLGNQRRTYCFLKYFTAFGGLGCAPDSRSRTSQTSKKVHKPFIRIRGLVIGAGQIRG